MKQEVKAVYDAYPPRLKAALLRLRALVLETARELDGVGDIEDTLKWSQPSLVTRPKTGSTIRVDVVKGTDDKYAMYFICNTGLVGKFRVRYPNVFEFGGKRALIFTVGHSLPETELKECIGAALTYHLKR